MIIAVTAEKFVNHLLRIDSDIDVGLLQQKNIFLNVVNAPIAWHIWVYKRRVSILSQIQTDVNYDLEMSFTKQGVLGLIKQKPSKELLNTDQVKVIGDVKIAQAVLDFVAQLNINYQEIVEYFAGQTAASSVNSCVQFIKQNPPPQPFIDLGKKGLEKIEQLVL